MKKQSQNKFCILHSAFCISAFTLIELVVVILVIGILAVLAIEKVASLAPIRDHLAADELQVNLRYIRNLAITRECTTRVIFDTNANFYSVWVSNPTNGVFALAKDPVTQAPWTNMIGRRFPDVKLSAVNNISNNTLCFSGTNGIPCYNTNTPLTANGAIVFDSGLTVTIVKDTGYVY